jgi:hypothetical protein
MSVCGRKGIIENTLKNDPSSEDFVRAVYERDTKDSVVKAQRKLQLLLHFA